MKATDRKAVYRYYRGLGYSAKEAANMRNRPRKVWVDYFERLSKVRDIRRDMPRYSRKRPLLPKPPKAGVDRRAIRAQFKRVGINPKMISRFMRLTDKNLMRRSVSLERMKESYELRSSFLGITKPYKQMLSEVDNMAEFWQTVEEVSGLESA